MSNANAPLLDRERESRGDSGSNNWLLAGIAAIVIVGGFIVGLYYLDTSLFEKNNEEVTESFTLWDQIEHDYVNITVGGYDICKWYDLLRPANSFALLDGKVLNISWADESVVIGTLCGHPHTEVLLQVPQEGPPSGSMSLKDEDLVLDETGKKWIKSKDVLNEFEATPSQWNQLYEMFHNYRQSIKDRIKDAPGVEGESVGSVPENVRGRWLNQKHKKVFVHLILEIKDGKNAFSDATRAIKYASALVGIVSEDLFFDVNVDLTVGSIVLNSEMFLSGSASAVSYLHALEEHNKPHESHILMAMTTRDMGSLAWPGGMYNGRWRAIAGGLLGKNLCRNDRRQVAKAFMELFGSEFNTNTTVKQVLEEVNSNYHAMKSQFDVIASGYSMMSSDCKSAELQPSTNKTSLKQCEKNCGTHPACIGFSYAWVNETCTMRTDLCDDLLVSFDPSPQVFFSRDAYVDSPSGFYPFAGSCFENTKWKSFEGVSQNHCAQLCKETKGCRGFSIRTDKYSYSSTCILERGAYENCETSLGVCDPEVQWCYFGLKWMLDAPLNYAPLKGQCDGNKLDIVKDTPLESCAEMCASNESCRGINYQENHDCTLISEVCELPLGRCDWTKEMCFFEKLD